jgi:predicted DNA-binding transcriptional regulator YafY
MDGQTALERQWLILRKLAARRHGATVKELAEDHQVNQKTIRRDLELLQRLGFPIQAQTGPHGRNHWVCTLDTGTPPLTFNIGEVLALYVGRSLLEPLAGTIVWEAAHSAFRKIRASLGEPALAYLEQLSGLIHRTAFRDSSYRDKSQLIDDLMVAIEDRRITFITYQSARSTEPLTYDVYPYGLVWHRGSLYLVAQSQQHGEVRTFKVDRLSRVAVETLKFQKPADFNLQNYLKSSLGIFHSDGPPQRVVIRFAPEVSQYVQEHHWHMSQKLTRLADGSVRAEFELTALEELQSWVLSFGAKAEVEEPEALRLMLLKELQTLLTRYGTEKKTTKSRTTRLRQR